MLGFKSVMKKIECGVCDLDRRNIAISDIVFWIWKWIKCEIENTMGFQIKKSNQTLMWSFQRGSFIWNDYRKMWFCYFKKCQLF